MPGNKEAKKRYRKKQYEKERTLTDLYRGMGAQPGEDYSTFKKRVLRKLI